MPNENPRPHLVMYDRRTGQIIGSPSAISAADYPFHVPDADTPLIRYVDFWKFEDMVTTNQLYFRRADKLDDHLEGRYAEANRTYLTKSYQQFLAQFKAEHDKGDMVMSGDVLRTGVFINCWQMMDSESLSMWSQFTKSPESVAMCTTFGRLMGSLPRDRQLGSAKVLYLDQSVPRAEWHSLAPFYAKDPRFRKEKELRVTFSREWEEVLSGLRGFEWVIS